MAWTGYRCMALETGLPCGALARPVRFADKPDLCPYVANDCCQHPKQAFSRWRKSTKTALHHAGRELVSCGQNGHQVLAKKDLAHFIKHKGTLMAFLKVTLTAIVDRSFPTWGRFEFVDVSGETIFIIEKLPVMGAREEVKMPMAVVLECLVVSKEDASMQIDTSHPHGVSDTKNRTQFQVNSELVVE